MQQQRQQQIKTPLWKTRMCKFAQAGKCSRGSKCQYAHFESELRAQPDFAMSSICPAVQVPGGVCKDANCRYAHDSAELREVPEELKTKACKFYARTVPQRCIWGAQCRFAHVDVVSAAKAQMEASQESSTCSPKSESTVSPGGSISGISTPDVWDDVAEAPEAWTAQSTSDSDVDAWVDQSCQECSPAPTTDWSNINEYGLFNVPSESQFWTWYFGQLNNTFSPTGDEHKSISKGVTRKDFWGERDIDIKNTFITIKDDSAFIVTRKRSRSCGI
jgi:hypothetical protein